MTEPLASMAQRVSAALADRYEITGPPELGGMSAVFPAWDRKHERRLAIKVLRADMAGSLDPARFLQEIKTQARLEHPHILGLIDSGTVDGLPYYVMPFIAGGTLRQRLTRDRQLEIDEAVRIASEVAAALEYAHRQGVIHRDVKPENIFLHQGSALVADFGISLMVRSGRDTRLTEAGTALGTPGYMSPEQAAGDRAIDARSDTYSLACVAYEMLAGEPPFTGPTAHIILSKMMTQAPTPLRVVRPSVPIHVEAAVLKGLEKAPSDRYASSAAFARALTDPTARTPDALPASRRSRRHLIQAAAFGFLLGAVGLGWLASHRSRRPETVVVPSTRQVTFSGDAEVVSMAPDGSMIAYLTGNRRTLVVQDLSNDAQLRLVTSTSPLGPPRWSPDGASLLFSGTLDGHPGLYTVPRLGGTPAPAVAAPGGDSLPVRLSPAYDFVPGTDLFAMSCCGARVYVGDDLADVRRVAADSFTASPGRLVDLGSLVRQVRDVSVSPDGKWIAFAGMTTEFRIVIGTAAIDGSTVQVVDTATERGLEDRRMGWSVRWSRDGTTLFYATVNGGGTDVLGIAINPRTGAPEGEPRAVIASLPAHIAFDLAPDKGRLVYAGGPERSRLVGVDRRTGATTQLSTGTWIYASPRLAPGGKLLAYTKGNAADVDIYVRALPGGTEERLTQDHLVVTGLAWSPDGTRIAYTAVTADGLEARTIDVRTRQVLTVGRGSPSPLAALLWSAHGDTLFSPRPQGLTALDPSHAAAPTPGARPVPGPGASPPAEDSTSDSTRAPALRIGAAVMSPDGRSLAALSFGAGGGGLWQIPLEGGRPVRLLSGLSVPVLWSRDGGIYFVRSTPDGADLTTIERVPAGGGPARVVQQLPFRCAIGDLTIAPEAGSAVCAVDETTTDVWLVDHLDLSVR